MDSLSTQDIFEVTSPSWANNVTSTPYNPWAGGIGTQQIIEIIYLSIVMILGTMGNLTVIFSIILENRVFAHGNIFVISLAFADLLVTGFVVPTVLANIVTGSNSLSTGGCIVAGYTVTMTCTCSLYNLTFIAVNRYWAVVHSRTYVQSFTKTKVYLMVALVWIAANLVSMPALLGWSEVWYDLKMQLCSWNDTYDYGYTLFLSICAIVIPLCVIFYCYAKLFLTVRKSGRWVRSLSTVSGVSSNNEQNRRSARKERNLFQTLATTVAFFCVCWLPYGFTIIVDIHGRIPALPKKIFGWMGLSNSALNFVIYGAMNPVFRRGYYNLFYFLCKCKRAGRLSSTALHGSHSDSLYKSGRRRSNQSTPNSRRSQKCSNPNLLVHQGSSFNLQQVLSYRSQKVKVWSTGVRPWLTGKNNSETLAYHTPQLPIKSNGITMSENKRPTSVIVSNQFKPAASAGLAALKRPTSLLKREKPGTLEQKITDRENRLKRNSLMLLQIEMNDDDGWTSEHRRTRSEIPNGVKKPNRKRTSTRSNNAVTAHSFGEVETHYFKDTSVKIEPYSEGDHHPDENEPESESIVLHDTGGSADSLGGLGSINEGAEINERPSLDSINFTVELRRSMRQKAAIEGVVVGGSSDDLESETDR